MVKYFILFLVGCLVSCTHKHSSGVEERTISSTTPQDVTVTITGDTYDHLENVLSPVSYVKLSAMPLLSHIKKIQIVDERIYVWDIAAGIVCYDIYGKLLFQINARGQGPGEYGNIDAFTVNSYIRQLVVYDNMKQSLMFYSIEDGKFIKKEKLNKPAPTEISYFGGYFYYHNRLHRNYQDDVSLHYYLLMSKDGIHVEQRYFEHEKNKEQYPFSPSRNNLYDNYSKLYYCRDFDNIVYQIYKDSIVPEFRIHLPQPLPISMIEEKPNEMDLLRSGYSLGITDVYEHDGILFFRFVKDGYIRSCLYNMKEKRQICCAKRIKFRHSSFIDTVDGIYKDCFYSILTPEYLDYALLEGAEECPEIFRTYNAQEDNPVIAFYQVAQPQ